MVRIPASGAGRTQLAAVVVLFVVAIAYWWPILIDPAGRLAGGNGDPLFIAYIVTWVAQHLFTPDLWNPPFFHPATNVLTYSDHLIGMGLLAWPAVAWGASPTLVVNAISFLAFLLTSLTMFWWLSDEVHDPLPVMAATLTVTYGAWRVHHVSHPQLLFVPFLPVALLCYQRVIQRRGPDGLAWIGAAALAVQTLFTPSLAVFMVPLVVIWLAVASVAWRRSEPRYWMLLAMSLAGVGLVNLPIAAHYWQAGHALARTPFEIRGFSVIWSDWMAVPIDHWLHGGGQIYTEMERQLFPGFGFVAVLMIGVVSSIGRLRPHGALHGMIVAGFAVWAATGPSEGNAWTLAHLPYDLLMTCVPGGDQVRVPARFILLAGIFLAPVMAAGWKYVFDFGRRVLMFPRLGTAAALLFLCATVAAGIPGPITYEPTLDFSKGTIQEDLQSAGLLVLPLVDDVEPGREIRRMWGARRSQVPIVNGYSGHTSHLYGLLRNLQRGQTDEEIRNGVYSQLLHFDVDTIVAEEPTPSLVDSSMVREIAPGVYRIPLTTPLPRWTTLMPGRGLGLLVTGSGWSYPEQNEREAWTWSVDARPTLLLPMDGSRPLALALRLRSLSEGRERLELWWNGRSLGTRLLSSKTALVTFPLPEAATRPGWTQFELRAPEPVRLPGSQDPRRLGLCLFEIRLEEI